MAAVNNIEEIFVNSTEANTRMCCASGSFAGNAFFFFFFAAMMFRGSFPVSH